MNDGIIAIRRIEARLTPFEWPFVSARKAEIDAHWARLKAEKPAMFNGQVLLQHRGGSCRASEADHILPGQMIEQIARRSGNKLQRTIRQ